MNGPTYAVGSGLTLAVATHVHATGVVMAIGTGRLFELVRRVQAIEFSPLRRLLTSKHNTASRIFARIPASICPVVAFQGAWLAFARNGQARCAEVALIVRKLRFVTGTFEDVIQLRRSGLLVFGQRTSDGLRP